MAVTRQPATVMATHQLIELVTQHVVEAAQGTQFPSREVVVHDNTGSRGHYLVRRAAVRCANAVLVGGAPKNDTACGWTTPAGEPRQRHSGACPGMLIRKAGQWISSAGRISLPRNVPRLGIGLAFRVVDGQCPGRGRLDETVKGFCSPGIACVPRSVSFQRGHVIRWTLGSVRPVARRGRPFRDSSAPAVEGDRERRGPFCEALPSCCGRLVALTSLAVGRIPAPRLSSMRRAGLLAVHRDSYRQRSFP